MTTLRKIKTLRSNHNDAKIESYLNTYGIHTAAGTVKRELEGGFIDGDGKLGKAVDRTYQKLEGDFENNPVDDLT